MRQDRFFLSILIGAGLLVLLALALFFLRQNSLDYGPEDSPAGVVRNYILALQKDEYGRAYAYLQDAEGKPDEDRFRLAFLSGELDISNVSVQVQGFERSGSEAAVNLVLLHTENAPFGNVWRETVGAVLVQDAAGAWKIASLPYPYWGWDWYSSQAPGKAPGKVPGTFKVPGT